jgi:hypothetical protein
MTNDHLIPATPRLITTYSRPSTAPGLVHTLAIYNSMVVITLVDWPVFGSTHPFFIFLCLNLATGVVRVVNHAVNEVNTDPFYDMYV